MGSVSQRVCRKPSSADIYPNFISHHHLTQKIVILFMLVHKAKGILDRENF